MAAPVIATTKCIGDAVSVYQIVKNDKNGRMMLRGYASPEIAGSWGAWGGEKSIDCSDAQNVYMTENLSMKSAFGTTSTLLPSSAVSVRCGGPTGRVYHKGPGGKTLRAYASEDIAESYDSRWREAPIVQDCTTLHIDFPISAAKPGPEYCMSEFTKCSKTAHSIVLDPNDVSDRRNTSDDRSCYRECAARDPRRCMAVQYNPATRECVMLRRAIANPETHRGNYTIGYRRCYMPIYKDLCA